MEQELGGFLQILNRLTAVYDRLPTMAATVAVNFSKERFRAQNWVDTNTEPWKKRKLVKGASKRMNRRGILIKSARLMRSIRKISANKDRAIIGTDVPYARAHNDGLKVKGTANVRQFNKRAYNRKRAGRTESVKAHTVKSHTRRVNLKLPQRRFLGASAVLDKRVERMMTAEIIKGIKG